LEGNIARGALGSLSLKVANIGFAFLISIMLARTLGVEAYGAYVFAMAWVFVLGIPAMLGMPGLLVRLIAIYHTQKSWGLLHGILRWSNRVVLAASIGLAAFTGLVAWLPGSTGGDQLMLTSVMVALISLPLIALMRIRQASMQGLQQVVIGQLPDMLIRPILFILFVAGAYFYFHLTISAPRAVGMHVAAIAVALLIEVWLLRRAIPPAVIKEAPIYHSREWLRGAMPLLFISGMAIITSRTDVIMLGMIKGADATGLYHVASRGAQFITLFLYSVNEALAPVIARLYAKGDMEALQRVVTESIRIILMFALPVALAMIFFGHWFLLIFGPDFVGSSNALAILSIGHLMDCAIGSVGLLLIMTGHGRESAIGMGIGAGVNIILNLLLIPKWGLEGAAIATTFSLILWNVVQSVLVYKRIGIHTTALGVLRWNNN